MKRPLEPQVAETLRSVGRRWKWLFFWQLTSILVIGFALAYFLLAIAIERAWMTNSIIAILSGVILALGFGVGFFVIGVIALAHGKPNSWLARKMENHAPRFLDRVNTLVFLQSRPLDPVTTAYFHGIGRQAGDEIARAPVRNPISRTSTFLFIAAAIITICFTGDYYRTHNVWQTLFEQNFTSPQSDDTLELGLPDSNAAELRSAWGEIRITEPGGDLKLTKVDVLPLTVEAASSQQLQQASWDTSVNGADPASHPLPAPQEPNYAVYQPVIYLDELGLSDWDVLSYFANATTEGEGRYASEIYFVEIRPFQSDLLKMESGAGAGKGMKCLDKLGALILQEQDILRQTYRQDQKPSANSEERNQDQKKLIAAQAELENATGHLYAEVAKLENQGVGTVLDQLALAEESMAKAVAELTVPDNPGARRQEQLALQQLVESRKDLVKIIRESGGQGGASNPGDNPPVAGMNKNLGGQLEDIEDIRDEGKAVLDAVGALRETQESIALEASEASNPEKLQKLSGRQQEAAKGLADIQEKIPQPFAGVQDAAAAAQTAMDLAGTMTDRTTAKKSTRAAATAMAELEGQLANQMSRQALGAVYRLKDLLDAQATSMAKMEKEPGDFSAGDFSQAANDAKSTKDLMAKTLQNSPAGQAFGPDLNEALTGQPGQDLDQAATQMRNASEDPASAAAGASLAKQSLEAITQAFETSQPAVLQGTKMTESSGGGSGVSNAMRMLNSLIQRLNDKRQANPEAEKKQLEEARLMLLAEAEAQPDDAPSLVAIAQELAELTERVDIEGDVEAFRKLMDRLESYRLEIADKTKPTSIDPKLLHADPAGAPAEFRERVRRYFEKLSDG